ncbi:MAG: tRNA (adenosine(37)-N6)-threonylcarbamoyltransferase complex transferase subunit TsaD [Bacillota bacterium]
MICQEAIIISDRSLILAIETSCDDTSAAVLEDGRNILANTIYSQIATHRPFGGVVPEIASRQHLEQIIPVIDGALAEAAISLQDLTAIGVTYGPGLVGALLVGVAQAKALAYALKIPLIGVHHLVGHIYANLIEHPNLKLPALCLVVSGGHTSLVLWRSHQEIKMLGATLDDAAGEAFDKIARELGLGYPGGPAIEKMAGFGDPNAFAFPRAWLGKGSLDFSFSGLKSAVLNYLNNTKQRGDQIPIADVSAGFQEAIVEVLVEKTILAAQMHDLNTIVLAGGVAANQRLRESLRQKTAATGRQVLWPSPVYCTDNAAMIAMAAYYRQLEGDFADLSLNAIPYLPLEAFFKK